jgi:5-methylcytosine-specific restriction endonuclease McrA
MRRSRRLRRRNGLHRRARLERRTALRRLTPPRRRPASPASEAQRTKVAGRSCLVCGRRPVDPAHLVPRSLGGCDEPDCVVPLDRRCHRAYDRGELDLLPYLEPRYRAVLAHALAHLSVLSLLRLVTGTRWRPVDTDIANTEERE